eukprot:9832096-Alexandrium_andersonii.AAC.1
MGGKLCGRLRRGTSAGWCLSPLIGAGPSGAGCADFLRPATLWPCRKSTGLLRRLRFGRASSLLLNSFSPRAGWDLAGVLKG